MLCAGGLCGAPAAAQAKHAPLYTSPHFRGPKTFPTNFVAATPPPPVQLATDGAVPHVFVDAAGTAHLAWSQEQADAPSILHYCRLERGGKACTATQAIAITQPVGAGFSGNGPGTDEDFEGPYPLAVGNELLTLDSRCCNDAPTPDGQTTGTPDYLFTSEDGGGTFTGPSDPNSAAGIVGTLEPSGGVAVFNGDDPEIGIVTDTKTGGTFFEGVPAGQFSRAAANMSVDSTDEAYDGRIGVDGIRPIISFDDLSGNTLVREWNGNGDVNDPAQWSVARVTGAYSPRIAGGPKGVVLLTEPGLLGGPVSARRVTNAGTTIGPPVQLSTAAAGFPAISADPVSGELAVSWIDRSASVPAVHVRTSSDGGASWGPDTIVADVPGGNLDELSVSATADGGGFVIFRDTAGSSGELTGKVDAAQFGPTIATGKAGLGLVPGSSGAPDDDPTAYATCTDVHMGDIDALTTAGCFLRDPKDQTSGAVVATGPIRLNGLDIIPDAGAKIYIDPHTHTIETDGNVSVELSGLSDGPIVLWHGGLHVTIPDVGDSATLFDFDTSQFASVLKGFPLAGDVPVNLTHDGVSIPVNIQLPSYMGGVHGSATLVADNSTGLHIDSLDIGVADANVGVLEFKNLDITYTFSNDLWTGTGEVLLPGPENPDLKIEDIEFQDGKFKDAQVSLSLYPGIPVFSDVYIASIGVGIGLNPTKLSGTIEAGAIPIAPPDTYTVDVTGTVALQIGDANDPTKFYVAGSGAILGFDLVNASFTYDSDGYVLFHVGLSFGGDSTWASFNANGDVFILNGDFGADLEAHGCLLTVCAGLKAAASKKGVAVCDDGENFGADLSFSPISLSIHPTSCHISDYEIQPPPAGARIAGAATSRTFTVAPGQAGVDLTVDGDTGPPDVTVIDPAGQAVTPQPLTDKTASVIGGADPTPGATDTVIGLRKPAAGTWTIQTDLGSPGITELMMAHDVPLPTIAAHVTGSGSRRVLHYALTHLVAGTTVRFAEQTSEGMHPIGMAAGATGTLKFQPAPGKGGGRPIVAVILQNGFNQGEPTVAHYTADAIRRPGRVRTVKVTQKGTTATVRFSAAANAVRYGVVLQASDGTSIQQTLRSVHPATFRHLRPGVKVQALVRGINVRGAAGPVTKSRKG
jgi:hypothetical protein